MANIHQQIAQELAVREQQVEAAVTLLDGGATVPFIARYRKEMTGALDDAQLRTLEERLAYLRELEERRNAVLNSIREQGKLDASLEAAILVADTKGRRHLCTVQAEAPHQGRDCEGNRPRAFVRDAADPATK